MINKTLRIFLNKKLGAIEFMNFVNKYKITKQELGLMLNSESDEQLFKSSIYEKGYGQGKYDLMKQIKHLNITLLDDLYKNYKCDMCGNIDLSVEFREDPYCDRNEMLNICDDCCRERNNET